MFVKVSSFENCVYTANPLFFFNYQAVKDDIGSVRIQRPHKGPFYVSDKTIDQLIGNLGKWSRFIYLLLSSLGTCTQTRAVWQ